LSDPKPDDSEPSKDLSLRHQDILARFGELALKSDDLDEILNEACRLVGEGLGTDLAKVMELHEEGMTLFVRAGVGWKPGVVGEVTLDAAGSTSEGYALKTGQPMISPDIETETRFTYPAFLIENGVRAVANVAIIGGRGRLPFGILQVDSRTPRQFTGQDIGFLRSYANLIAAAVDRLRVLALVRNEEKRLRLALEAGDLGSWDLDLATGIVTSTARYMQVFGYADPSAAWSYELFLSHVLPEDRAQVVSVFRKAIDTAVEWQSECRIRRASDNRVRWIELKGRAVGEQNNTPPTHLLGIVADITDRKTAQAALLRSNERLEAKVAERTRALVEASEKLQAAAADRDRVEAALRQSSKMEAVGQLTGGLAHDFNNLLGAIAGSLEMIQVRLAQGRTAELDRYVETALASTTSAAVLTHRLLAFARRQTLEPKPVEVKELVGGMVDLFRRTIGPSIQLESRLAGELWPPLCDPNQLESALLNLVINARDAMPDGGLLVIEAANTTISDRRGAPRGSSPGLPPGDYALLRVTDTGTGMTPDVLARAFDPFFTTKPIGQGTGLGLSMAYGFAQQSGGQIKLSSVEGQGTTVSIHLPRYLGAVERRKKLAVAADSTGVVTSGVVLVVEDEAPMRMLVVDVLVDQGYTVLQSDRGRSGLDLVASTPQLDLLVTDVGLPDGMNGRQLADAAWKMRPDLKVLFITGYADGAPVGNSLLDDRMQVMTKPFRLNAFLTKVREIMDD